MATLLLRLVGPMQSWGTTSRFNQRDTGKEPSKSGVLGLLAAALGIDREDENSLKPLASLLMAVRHDRPGVLKYDFQTAGCASTDTIITSDGGKSKDGVVSRRYYLADAAFLVALESENRSLLETIQAALKNPVWPLSLGRKSYIPSEMVWFKEGIHDVDFYKLMTTWPWISSLRRNERMPERLLLSWESNDGCGVLKMDQPLSNFSTRHFGACFVKSDWIVLTQGEI